MNILRAFIESSPAVIGIYGGGDDLIDTLFKRLNSYSLHKPIIVTENHQIIVEELIAKKQDESISLVLKNITEDFIKSKLFTALIVNGRCKRIRTILFTTNYLGLFTERRHVYLRSNITCHLYLTESITEDNRSEIYKKSFGTLLIENQEIFTLLCSHYKYIGHIGHNGRDLLLFPKNFF